VAAARARGRRCQPHSRTSDGACDAHCRNASAARDDTDSARRAAASSCEQNVKHGNTGANEAATQKQRVCAHQHSWQVGAFHDHPTFHLTEHRLVPCRHFKQQQQQQHFKRAVAPIHRHTPGLDGHHAYFAALKVGTAADHRSPATRRSCTHHGRYVLRRER
jgi:hypothetical protein